MDAREAGASLLLARGDEVDRLLTEYGELFTPLV